MPWLSDWCPWDTLLNMAACWAPGARCALTEPWPRVECDFLWDAGGSEGPRPADRLYRGWIWQALGFLSQTALRSPFSSPLLQSMTPTFPLPTPPLPALNECGGNLASQRLEENEDISQMACSSGCVLAARAVGSQKPVPCASPKYPKYVPSLAAKPQ